MKCLVLEQCYIDSGGHGCALREPGDVVDFVGKEKSRPPFLKPVDVEDEVTRIEKPDNAEIKAAVLQLDAKNDEHWTKSGMPAMKVVENMVGSALITRDDVTLALPNYNRKLLLDNE